MDADRFRLIAFYLPQFHPIPENDAWWGRGFTEWTNVVKAKPLFPEHYQPHLPADLGFYDLRLADARQAQAELAREYGIHGFCYYHYWFNGKLLLEQPFNEVLASGEPDFPFCLCWANENWTRTWDGLERHVLIDQKYSLDDDRRHIHWLVKAFQDRRYIRIEGKPLFLVYRISNLPDPIQTVSVWREEAKKLGIGEIYLATVESLPQDRIDPIRLGFDAAVEFQPDWLNMGSPRRRRPGFLWGRLHSGISVYDYSTIIKMALCKATTSYNRFPCVSPGWDNTPRRIKNAIVIAGASPELYQNWLNQVLENFVPARSEENLVFVNAWNEWGEGAHLEPCQKWGRGYLEATRKALECVTANPPSSIRKQPQKRRAFVSKPKLSVCIPTYNGAAYVREAINSVLHQTFVDFELIVVDDCSIDDTESQIQSFADRRILYYKNPSRLGLIGNWNRCLELSEAEYVCIFHQDDVMMPQNLEKKVKILHEATNVGMVHSNVFQIDAAGNVLSRWWYHKPNREENGVHSGSVYFKTLLSGPNIVCCPGAIVRRECYDRLGGFDPQLPFTADWEMWMRIALFYDIGYLIEPLVKYRRHTDMETANFLGVKELEHELSAKKAVLRKHPNRIPNIELLKLQTADTIEKQAVERALQCCPHGEYVLAREYLSFAAKVHENTIGQSSRTGASDQALRIIDQSENEHFQRASRRDEMESKEAKSGLNNAHLSVSHIATRYPETSEQSSPPPSVSVIIPSDKVGAYLDQAVQSVLNQNYEDFEILIIDDGSADAATQHLFASFQRPKARILRTENQGLAKAKNLAVKEARGRYVSCIDAYGVVDPTFLQQTVEALESDPAIAFASCWVRSFGETQLSWNPTTCDFPHLLVNETAGAAVLMRRDAVLEIGGFDYNMPVPGYEDWDLAITLVEHGKRGMIIPEYLVRYRIRQGSMSGSCTEPVDHASLMRYLVDKHGGSYKKHLAGVLEAIEKRTLDLEGSKPDIGSNTFPEVAQRLTFFEESLRSVLESRNWRLTEPLRRGIGRLQRFGKYLVERNVARPRISVIVNCGRDGEDLRRSLDSLWFLVNGTGRILLVDDGSSDAITREMIAWYYNAGIDVLHKHGVSSARAREAGLSQARAPILFALNAGDTVEANTFRKAMEILESEEHTAFVSFGLCDQTSGLTWIPESAELPELLACPRVAFPMLKRDALLRIQGYDGSFSKPRQADWDLTLKLAAQGERGIVLSEPLVHRGNVKMSLADLSSDRTMVRQVVAKHRVLFENHYAQTILGHDNLRRRVQAHVEPTENLTSVSSLTEAID